MNLTKAQREALLEAAGPRKRVGGLSFGDGKIVAHTRVEKALIRLGLAQASGDYPFRGSSVWITEAGRAEAKAIESRGARGKAAS